MDDRSLIDLKIKIKDKRQKIKVWNILKEVFVGAVVPPDLT